MFNEYNVHQCPVCELRFWHLTEMEDHILRDHPDRADLVQRRDPYHREPDREPDRSDDPAV